MFGRVPFHRPIGPQTRVRVGAKRESGASAVEDMPELYPQL